MLVCDSAIADWCQRADDLLNDRAAIQRAMLDNEDNDDGGPYTPTEEEIKAECERIRAGWTPKEERARRVMKGIPLEAGIYKVARQSRKLPE